MWNLANKTALVTGGTKGIGKATVMEFLKLGAHVIFTARNQEDINSLTSRLRENGQQVTGIRSDVGIEKDLVALKALVENQFDNLDILVNNAGINIRKSAMEYNKEEIQQIIAINLMAPFAVSRLFYSLLKKADHASIINIASVAASQDVNSGAPYAMAKSGLLQQTRSLAVEWATDGIRVNSVSPWYTQTPLTASVLENKDKLDVIRKRTPIGRVAKPEEIANAISFLAMNKSSYITGQNLILDGGMSVHAL